MDLAYRTRAIISRGLYIIPPFFTTVYNQERLMLQTIFTEFTKLLPILFPKWKNLLLW